MAYWPLWEPLVIFAASFAAGLITSILLLVIWESASPGSFTFFSRESIMRYWIIVLITTIVADGLLVGGTLFSVLRRHGARLESIGLDFEKVSGNIYWGLATGIPMLFVGIGLGYLSNLIFRGTADPGASGAGPDYAISTIVIIALVLVVLAPVCEEIFFRGYLFSAMRNRMSLQPALLLSACLFAFVHFEAIGFLPRFAVGYALGIIYEYRRNLIAPIVAHAVYNGGLLALSLIKVL
ncbi:MAG: CPBP family intramembrane metalloprotease [Deltaproteobacteria bacterium]|nr:CPBP family intramembrane metalloprotease [Deltaproteobacteria bacterium]